MNQNNTFSFLLITFGFIILLHNLDLINIPDVFNFFRKFWPLILIYIGVDRILKNKKNNSNNDVKD